MVCYETLMLMRPEMSGDELSNVERHFEELISKAGGKMHVVDRWGKYQLAYPVRKNTYGIYCLIRYQLPKETYAKTLKEDVALFFKIKHHDDVMRYFTKRLDDDFKQYQKPEPLSIVGEKSPTEAKKIEMPVEAEEEIQPKTEEA